MAGSGLYVPLSGKRYSFNPLLGGGGPGGLPNTDQGSDIRDWFAQPTGPGTEAEANGGVLYAPVVESDGVTPRLYHGGMVDCIARPSYLHPFTPGAANNGWLTILPFVPPSVAANGDITTQFLYDAGLTAGGASLGDQNNGGCLHFGTHDDNKGVGDFRIALGGMEFLNGPILNGFGMRRFKTWYCWTAYTAAAHAAQYDAVAAANGFATGYPRNNTTVRNLMKGNYNNNGFNLRNTFDPWRCQYICLLGPDTADMKDDQINMVGARNMRVHGWKGLWSTDTTAYSDDHGDTLQLEGGEWDIILEYVLLGGHVEAIQSYEEGDCGVSGIIGSGGKAGLVVHHAWQCASPNIAGVSLGPAGTDVNGNPVTNLHRPYNCGFASSVPGTGVLPDLGGISGDYWKWFGNPDPGEGNDGGSEFVFPDQPSFTWPRNYTHEWPSGSGGSSSTTTLPNRANTSHHAACPPNLWRVAFPYDSFFDYIATYGATDPVLDWN